GKSPRPPGANCRRARPSRRLRPRQHVVDTSPRKKPGPGERPPGPPGSDQGQRGERRDVHRASLKGIRILSKGARKADTRDLTPGRLNGTLLLALKRRDCQMRRHRTKKMPSSLHALDSRSRTILKEIIRVHVDTGRPVSSRALFKSVTLAFPPPPNTNISP